MTIIKYGSNGMAGLEVKDRYTGEFSYVPVADSVPGKKGYWALAMDDVQIGGASVTTTRKAIVDSGTSLIAVPKAEIAAIASKVGAKPSGITSTSFSRLSSFAIPGKLPP